MKDCGNLGPCTRPSSPPSRKAWGAWKGVLRAGGILRGPERGAHAGPVGVSQGSSTPIVRPGGGGWQSRALGGGVVDCGLWRLRLPGRALHGERPDGNPAAAPRSLRGGTWGAAALPSPAGSGARRYLRARRGPRAGWVPRTNLDWIGPQKGERAEYGDGAPRRGPTSAIPDPALLPQGSPRGLRSAPFFSPRAWVP